MKSYDCKPHRWVVIGNAHAGLYVTAECELCGTVATRLRTDIFLSRHSPEGIRVAFQLLDH